MRIKSSINKAIDRAKGAVQLAKDVYGYGKMIKEFDENVSRKRNRPSGLYRQTKEDEEHIKRTDAQYNKIIKSVRRTLGK